MTVVAVSDEPRKINAGSPPDPSTSAIMMPIYRLGALAAPPPFGDDIRVNVVYFLYHV